MLIIGIAGGSGSGKTTVVKAITQQLKEKAVSYTHLTLPMTPYV